MDKYVLDKPMKLLKPEAPFPEHASPTRKVNYQDDPFAANIPLSQPNSHKDDKLL